LLSGGYAIDIIGEAADIEDSISLVEATRPNMAVVPDSLPELDGIVLAAQLKHRFPETKLLLHSAVYNESLIINALEIGVSAVILKRDPAIELVDAVRAVGIGRRYFSSGISRSFLERLEHPRRRHRAPCLTAREREVVEMIAQGQTNKTVARRASMSPKTVETHRCHVMEKLDLRTAAELVRFAVRNEIITA
jgi:DNA-binding NarL/FixJ family response regulator